MRKLKIAAGVLLALLVGLVLLVAAVPLLLRDRVVAALEDAADAHLRAEVGFGDVGLTLLSSFPDLTVTVSDVSVRGEGPFADVELARVAEVAVTLDLMSVLGGGTPEIEGLAVVRPKLHVVVDEEGRSNLDLLPPADDEVAEASEWSLSLRDYRVEDLELLYEDRAAGRRVELTDLDHHGSGDLSSDRVRLETRTDVAALSVLEGRTHLLRDVAVGWDLALDLDQDTGRIELRDNRLQLNELALTATGTAEPAGEDWELDLAFETLETSFRSLLSLVPAVYSEDFEGIVSGGTLALNGEVRGVLPASGETLPAFRVNLAVADGRFKYPDLPVGIGAVGIEARVEHPGGDPDLAVVDVARFHAEVDGQPVDGRMELKRLVSDPEIDARLAGKLDLARLGQALPPSDVRYTGRVDLDVKVAGAVSAFEAQQVDRVTASGSVDVADLVYEDPELSAVPITVERLAATVDPRRVTVGELKLRLGESDLSGTVRLDNLLSYALDDDVLEGELELRSSSLDLDAIAGTTDEDGEAAEEGSSLYVVPDDVDLSVQTRFDRVRYGGRDYRDVRGRVHADRGTLRMDDLEMKLLDGLLVLDGTYRAENAEAADVEVAVDVRDLGVGGVVSTFETLRRVVPIAAKAPGRFNSTISFTTRLGPDLSPDLSTLFSVGDVQLFGVELAPAVLQQVADKVKNGRLTGLDLDGSKLHFEVKNGRLALDPTKLALGGFDATLKGSTGTLDQTLDLRLDLALPVGAVGGGVLGSLDLGSGGEVPVAVLVKGTTTAPKLSVDFGAAVGGVASDLKDKAVEEVTARVDAAVDQALAAARAQGDALVAEAENVADQLRSAASKEAGKLRKAAAKEADKLVAAASNPIAKKLAQEAADKVVAEADKAAKKVEREADKAADAAVAEAKTKRDALIAEAEAQAKR